MGVNPGGLGDHDPPDFEQRELLGGVALGSWTGREIVFESGDF